MAAFSPASMNSMGGTDFAVAGGGMQDEGFGSAQVGLTWVEKRLLDCAFNWYSWDRYQLNEY
jgi:hypothetical protein